MASAVTYQFYSETYGGGLSEAAFGLALPAAERHVRWLVDAREPADGELVAYHRAVCAAVDALNSVGAFEVPAGSRIDIGGHSYYVAECKRCDDFNGHLHHWELPIDDPDELSELDF